MITFIRQKYAKMGNFEAYLAIPSESLLYDHKTCFTDSLEVRLCVFHVCSQGNISGPFLTHNRVKICQNSGFVYVAFYLKLVLRSLEQLLKDCIK